MVNGVKFTFQQGAASVVVNSATAVTVTDNWAAMTNASPIGTSFYNAFISAQSSGAAAAALSTVTVSSDDFGLEYRLYLQDVQPGVSPTVTSSGATYEAVGSTPKIPGSASAADNHGSLSLSLSSGSGIVWSGANAAYAGLAPSGSQAASSSSTLSSIASVDVLTSASATVALTAIDGALNSVNASRAVLGAMQNRFSSVVASLQGTAQNLSASVSRIQDADFAQETAKLSRAQILQQAGTAMVAQANQQPQEVLALLR